MYAVLCCNLYVHAVICMYSTFLSFSSGSVLFSRSNLLKRKDLCFSRLMPYNMYSTFLTGSTGSVLFSRSNLLNRKDLYFSCLRLGLIRHRRSLRSSHLFSSGLTRFRRVTTRARPPAPPCVPYGVVSLCISVHRFSSAPDLS
jgi:hypothetical protein